MCVYFNNWCIDSKVHFPTPHLRLQQTRRHPSKAVPKPSGKSPLPTAATLPKGSIMQRTTLATVSPHLSVILLQIWKRKTRLVNWLTGKWTRVRGRCPWMTWRCLQTTRRRFVFWPKQSSSRRYFVRDVQRSALWARIRFRYQRATVARGFELSNARQRCS